MPAADPHSATEGPRSSLAAALAELHVGLARAADPRGMLAALLHALERRGPARVELGELGRDEHGEPRTLTRTASWTADSPAPASSPANAPASSPANAPASSPANASPAPASSPANASPASASSPANAPASSPANASPAPASSPANAPASSPANASPAPHHPAAATIPPHSLQPPAAPRLDSLAVLRGALRHEPDRPRPLAEVPLARLWLAAPGEPLHIADLADDPRVHLDERAALSPWRALTVLPLRARGADPWHGCITLLWTAPHPAAPEDQFVDRLLMQTVAATLAGRRSVQAHADALAESRSLQAAQARLHATDSLADLLAVLAGLTDDASVAWLLRAPTDGPPHLLASQGDTGLTVGAPVQLVPVTEPRFLDDLDGTPLLDRTDLRAAAIVPLRWRGRTTAILALGWSTPHNFTASERRLLTAAAREAAVVVDNRLLRAAAEDALREHQRERATLEAILHHLPVGVVVHSLDRGAPTLVNRQAEQLRRDLAADTLVYPDTDTPMPDDQWPIARAIREGQVVVGEVELRAADGRRRTLESVAAPIHDDGGAITHVIAVTTEVTAWREAEAERARMHELLVRAQAEALAERSTPLLPIADDILVMPIVGSIDEERGQQITETLVDLGGFRRIRVAIIDVTGAGELDPRAVDLLVGAARALRLRGARPLLTGLSTAVAASLAGHGVELGDIAVCGSLQDGIRRARLLARAR